jgi:oligopeptide transport system substrate-binding protein
MRDPLRHLMASHRYTPIFIPREDEIAAALPPVGQCREAPTARWQCARCAGKKSVMTARFVLFAAMIAFTLGSCGRRSSSAPVVVSAIGAPPATVDPGSIPLGTASSLLMAATAQGLVRLDGAGQVEPGLAERWTLIDDGRSYIFRLRNATWSDGKPVTSDQVVTILNRQLGKASRNPLAPFVSAIAQVRAMTPEVIEIDLSTPRPDLLRLLAQPEFAIFRLNSPAGTGPMAIVRWLGRRMVELQPKRDDSLDPDGEPAAATPADRVILIGERAALAIVRFAAHQSDMVTGGRFTDWPLIAGSEVPASSLRRDPASGLFGLAVVSRDGFLADPANRAALAEALDRDAILASIAPDWPARSTVLPDQLDSAAPPAQPDWTPLTIDQRRAAARARVTAWGHGSDKRPVVVRIALPAGPGATLLYGALGASLIDIGAVPQRVALDDPADLKLIDAVAPTDSARWYLATACVLCSSDVTAAVEAARVAPTLVLRAQALAQADLALTKDAAFIPLGSPLRWSMVGPGLDQWQPNAAAWHPLTQLRSPPT